MNPEPSPSPPAAPPIEIPIKTRHGRAPKDRRGDRNKRKRGQFYAQAVNWGAK